MTSFQLRGRVRADGTLDLQVPAGLPETDVEVLVVLQPVPAPNGASGHAAVVGKTPEELGWPPGFFESTAGCWEGEPLERAPQGEYEEREPLQ
jgi:hypothetical protein